jgi:hypothetical protein
MHGGVRQRLLNALSPNTPEPERDANLHLLAGEEYLPRHMRNQFLEDPQYPGVETGKPAETAGRRESGLPPKSQAAAGQPERILPAEGVRGAGGAFSIH